MSVSGVFIYIFFFHSLTLSHSPLLFAFVQQNPSDPAVTQLTVALFATQVIPKSQIIGEFTGLVVSKKPDVMPTGMSKALFPLSKDGRAGDSDWLFVDATLVGNEISRANHYSVAGAEKPNAKYTYSHAGVCVQSVPRVHCV